jgi:hypothetical protein
VVVGQTGVSIKSKPGGRGRPPHIAILTPEKEKANHVSMTGVYFYAGDDLLSHTLSRAVQSALRGLTSVFGMGTGGSPAVRSPTN